MTETKTGLTLPTIDSSLQSTETSTIAIQRPNTNDEYHETSEIEIAVGEAGDFFPAFKTSDFSHVFALKRLSARSRSSLLNSISPLPTLSAVTVFRGVFDTLKMQASRNIERGVLG